VESFIYKVRLVLLDKDIPEKPELMNYLKGEDTKDNLQITHKDSNRRKGASRTDTKL
jgi:hypothetical protein